MSKNYLTMQEVMEKLGRTRQSVNYLVTSGKIKKFKNKLGQVFFLEEEIDQLSKLQRVSQ